MLLITWSPDPGGVPPFHKVQVAQFQPALEEAMAKNLEAIDAIASNPAPPDFENTITAMERAGTLMNRVMPIYDVWSSNMSTSDFQEAERVLEPKLSAYRDKIQQNSALFARIEAVWLSPAKAKLTPEQQRLVWDYYTDFVRAGAKLSAAQKQRISEINQRLAALYTQFSNNLLHDEEDYVLFLNADQLGGLPKSLIDAAAGCARRKQPGSTPSQYPLRGASPSVQSALREGLAHVL